MATDCSYNITVCSSQITTWTLPSWRGQNFHRNGRSRNQKSYLEQCEKLLTIGQSLDLDTLGVTNITNHPWCIFIPAIPSTFPLKFNSIRGKKANLCRPITTLPHCGKKQNVCDFTDVFNILSFDENLCISISDISLECITEVVINNQQELVLTRDWRRVVEKVLSKPIIVPYSDGYIRHSFLTSYERFTNWRTITMTS